MKKNMTGLFIILGILIVGGFALFGLTQGTAYDDINKLPRGYNDGLFIIYNEIYYDVDETGAVLQPPTLGGYRFANPETQSDACELLSDIYDDKTLRESERDCRTDILTENPDLVSAGSCYWLANEEYGIIGFENCETFFQSGGDVSSVPESALVPLNTIQGLYLYEAPATETGTGDTSGTSTGGTDVTTDSGSSTGTPTSGGDTGGTPTTPTNDTKDPSGDGDGDSDTINIGGWLIGILVIIIFIAIAVAMTKKR